ncbi:MAG TPA: malto-oligosyltrehalose synthase [Trueperaceae bacterium]
MSASYRLQLTPEFGFADVEALIPYLEKLGVTYLYLSPITEARQGSTHGYDVVDHNAIRDELGGEASFERLRDAVHTAGLELILDVVPNHSGVGPYNNAWQDVLAYGPHSRWASTFDIDWAPLKPELRNKVLLPFLGRPYGDALDAGDISLAYENGRFFARYFDDRFALSPASYERILAAALPEFERTEAYFDLKDLREAYGGLRPEERERAEGLATRLAALMERLDVGPALASFQGTALHELLEHQFWRLAYWKTAGYEINYRRFFDINGLVALRMEDPEVFWDAHRLLGALVVKDGVSGLRVDHVDGLFDPQGYLEKLRELGAERVWVEKILAPGETLPEAWCTVGTTGYEFLNDAMGVLIDPGGKLSLLRSYRRFLDENVSYAAEVWRSKRLVMETTLSGELQRLAGELGRLGEADYHTRDFTLEALREALAGVIAAFPRYRTYLPHDPEEAARVVGESVRAARRRNPAFEPSVYDFIERALTGQLRPGLESAQREFVGRFQQFTAPVAAKGVEDTAFYRYVPLAAQNEVGGDPEEFGLTPQAFHAHARFRAFRYPDNLLATATHDHKRGEDTRMRLIVLAELGESWQDALGELARATEPFRSGGLETAPEEQGPSRNDEYLFYQHLLALWVGAERPALADRLVAYMQKAVREAKLYSSWLNPNTAYEAAVEHFVREAVASDEVAAIVTPLADKLARFGFANSLSQVVLKLTTPGLPDFYQGTELPDLSLVDPDNRRPVDYGRRHALLDEFGPLLERPAPQPLLGWAESGDERAKLYVVARILRVRRERPEVFAGEYRPLEAEGEAAAHVLAFSRETESGCLLVVVTRFPAKLAQRGGWGDTRLPLPELLAGRAWQELLTGQPVAPADALAPDAWPLGVAVLLADGGA